MNTVKLSKSLLVLLGVLTIASTAWGESYETKNDAQTENLRAVDKADALAPGTEAANTVMRDTPASELAVAATIVGKVTAVDTANNTLTVKEDKSGKKQTLSAINADILKTLKKGDRVRVSTALNNQAGSTVFKA